MTKELRVDAEFSGGNIVVEDIAGDEIRLHQDLRDTARDWFYWCFRIRGAAGRTPRFTFTRSRAIGVRGPALSLDEGKTWRWLGPHVVEGSSFHCPFPADAAEARLSFAMPYQESDWRRFTAAVTAGHPLVEEGSLCVTPKGRAVECMTLKCHRGQPSCRVVITCRHHCCEMMANYVLEGIILWFLRDDEARWLRDNAEFFLVPFVDKDGVEDGDQGKGRQPRDHGRDYEGESLYASTKALRERLPEWWGVTPFRVGLDLHCPHISGPHNEEIYLVGSADDRIAAQQRAFSRLLESAIRGPLPFLAANYLPFGEAWNVARNYEGGKSFARWIAALPGVTLGTSIEVPYANACGAEVNQTTARAFGEDLARALMRYLQCHAVSGSLSSYGRMVGLANLSRAR